MAEGLKVVVACHKPYWVPDDSTYVPVQVGAAGKETIPGFQRDDEGENISEKNPSYCELTGLYWGWKNLDADWLGLAHYRRHFSNGSLSSDRRERVASGEFLWRMLTKTPVILPVERNYFIETNRSQYAHAHHEHDLNLTREVLAELHPEVVASFDNSMSLTHGHRFNMMLMRRDLVDEWCAWVFEVLSELENRVDIAGYSDNDRRVYGFIAERLIDPWLEACGIEYQNLPVVNIEGENWLRKGSSFIVRKIRGSRRTTE